MAGVPLGDDPAGTTNTWKEGPDAGAGVQLNAQPMFQLAAVVVKAGLVQLPWSCVGPRSTRAGPAATVDDVVADPPAAVVVVVDPLVAAAVVVDPPAAAVVVVDPVDLGMVYAGALEEDDPVEPDEGALAAMPTRRKTSATTAICHDFQVRFSLICRSPGAGNGSGPAGPGAVRPGSATPPLLVEGGNDMRKRWLEFWAPSRQRRDLGGWDSGDQPTPEYA